MIKEHKVIRLEQALQSWEDLCFLLEMILRYGSEQMKKNYKFGLSGPIINHGKLRTALLKTSEKFAIDDYLGEREIFKFFAETALLPLSLFLWSRFSRRVFQLSSDLQTLLSAISLERVTWDMVNIPLPSFVITFPEPLKDNLGWEADCVLFADITELMKKYRDIGEDKKILHYSLFSNNLENVKPISWDDKNRMKKAIMRKDYAKFIRFGRKHLKGGEIESSNTHQIRSGSVEISLGKDEPVIGTFMRQVTDENTTEDKYQMSSVIEKAFHQMVTLCLYLDSLKPAERKNSVKEVTIAGKKKTDNPKAITDVADIFTVKCEHYLSDEDKSVINEIRRNRESGSTMCVHWRRGYCRRMPGMGNDPDAPKIVIVKPTFVNAKILKPDTLPPGSKASVT